jgi:hypothetical protein
MINYKPTLRYCGMPSQFWLFVYTSFCLCRLMLLLHYSLQFVHFHSTHRSSSNSVCAWPLSPLFQSVIYIYIYICTRVHIIPQLVLLPLGGFLLLFHSIFIYSYLASSLILLLPKLSFFALWCTEPLPIPPCHLLSSL